MGIVYQKLRGYCLGRELPGRFPDVVSAKLGEPKLAAGSLAILRGCGVE